MARKPLTAAQRQTACKTHAQESVAAARRIIAALEAGEPPKLSDAKILEAAGCYIRRNGAA